MTDTDARAILLPDATLPELEERVECLETDMHLLKNEEIKTTSDEMDRLKRQVEALLSNNQDMMRKITALEQRDEDMMREMTALKRRDDAQQDKIEILTTRNQTLERRVEGLEKEKRSPQAKQQDKSQDMVKPAQPDVVSTKPSKARENASSKAGRGAKTSPVNSSTLILNDEEFEGMLQSKVGDNERLKTRIRSIRSNSCRPFLDLSYNSISDQGGVALAEALKSNSTLTHLYLNNNSISDQGGVALAEALKSNSTLTELSLNINSISDQGGVALAEALKSNSTLTYLNLMGNNISEQVQQQIRNATSSCKLYL